MTETNSKTELKMQSKDLNLGEMAKVLTCGVCGEIFNEPVTLFCNHTFCHLCLINLKGNWTGTKQCPLCQTKIWNPSLKTVNFVIRDLVKLIFGEEKYLEVYREREKDILKYDLKSKVTQELKDEMWRSISDSLNQQHNPKDNFNLNSPPSISIPKSAPCVNYNSIYGCNLEDDECQFGHRPDAKLLMKHLKKLKDDFGYLFTNQTICADYNRIKGCSMGDSCEYAHVPHITTLRDEIVYYRENKLGLPIQRFDLVMFLLMFVFFSGIMYFLARKRT